MCLGNYSHIFFWHQAISGHFPRWPPKKLTSGHDILLPIKSIVFKFCMLGSLGISDDLINFWEEFIKNKMGDGGHFEKMAAQKACEHDIL